MPSRLLASVLWVDYKLCSKLVDDRGDELMKPTFGIVKTPRDYYLYWGVACVFIAVIMFMAKLIPSGTAFVAVSLVSFAIHFYRRSKAKRR